MRSPAHRAPLRRPKPRLATAADRAAARERPALRATRLFALAAAPTAFATTAIGTTLAHVDVATMEQALRAWQDWWLRWSGWSIGLAALSAGTVAGLYGLGVRGGQPRDDDDDAELRLELEDVPRASGNVVSLDAERARRRPPTTGRAMR